MGIWNKGRVNNAGGHLQQFGKQTLSRLVFIYGGGGIVYIQQDFFFFRLGQTNGIRPWHFRLEYHEDDGDIRTRLRLDAGQEKEKTILVKGWMSDGRSPGSSNRLMISAERMNKIKDPSICC